MVAVSMVEIITSCTYQELFSESNRSSTIAGTRITSARVEFDTNLVADVELPDSEVHQVLAEEHLAGTAAVPGEGAERFGERVPSSGRW